MRAVKLKRTNSTAENATSVSSSEAGEHAEAACKRLAALRIAPASPDS